jgi:ATP-dependent DNA helicase RecG
MYPAEVDAALASPAAAVVEALLALDEGQWYDRKSAKVAAKDLAVTMVAMANAEGGAIVVGLHDGSADDVSATPGRVSSLLQASMDHTRPPVRARGRTLSALNSDGQEITLVVFEVEPGDSVHETMSGECYLRVGDESRRLGFHQRQELTYDRGGAPFDGTPTEATFEELDEALLDDFRRSTGADLGIEHLLAARSLVRADHRLSVAAYLLFGKLPQQRMPHAHVRVLRYLGEARGTGSRLTLDADGDRRCEGGIPTVLQEAADVIEDVLPKRRALGSSGRFEAVPIIPRDAWLEGLVNAVVHRSYSATGDHIRVEVFPDRIEIESPGRFPGLVDPRRPLDIARYARNPRIARVCADLNIGRELGEGIHRIFDEMRIAGLSEPVYQQTPQSTRLVLSATAAIPIDVRQALPRGSERILALLRTAHTPLGTGEIVEGTDLSRPTVNKALRLLREAGFVEWQGKSLKDPRATWSMR